MVAQRTFTFETPRGNVLLSIMAFCISILIIHWLYTLMITLIFYIAVICALLWLFDGAMNWLKTNVYERFRYYVRSKPDKDEDSDDEEPDKISIVEKTGS